MSNPDEQLSTLLSLISKLEPGVDAAAPRAVETSIAISLKRLADIMEEILITAKAQGAMDT